MTPTAAVSATARWRSKTCNSGRYPIWGVICRFPSTCALIANADASGNASGRYRTLAQGPGELELNARLMRVDVARIHRYMPAVAGESVRQWLRSSLTKGRTDEVRLKINGNLAEFPFADGKGGQFSVVAKGRDLSLDYARNWPAVTTADAEERIEG